MAVLARWVVLGFLAFATVRWFRRGASHTTTVDGRDPIAAAEEDPYRLRFEAIHRQIIGRERSFNVIEAKLGLIALSALVLVEVYFPADLTLVDKILAELLFVSALIALFGFRFFAGYEAFDVKDFAEGTRSITDILTFTDKMVDVAARNERMIAAKQRLLLWALLPLVIVSGFVPFTRHASAVPAAPLGQRSQIRSARTELVRLGSKKKAGPARDRLVITVEKKRELPTR